ncbi:C39 family peptidase [Bombilactobacillus bombi]|uniref:C39 family peptidase n=1 Tax=Bombilactobacillus bombi TaxID=1303590 RepID=UPI0015E59D0B|nr:hypothetical protein [Bombilactobacillus bombi]
MNLLSKKYNIYQLLIASLALLSWFWLFQIRPVQADSANYTDTKVSGVVTVKSQTAPLYNDNGQLIVSRALGPHSAWLTGLLRIINGQQYYQVSTHEYIAADSVTYQTQKVLGVPFISQEAAGAPMGCEAASGLEALHYKNYAKNYDLRAFLRTMPIAGDNNPYHGFGGTPYRVTPGIYQSIFPDAYTPWLNKFGHAANLSGATKADLQQQIDRGNPVVTWVTLRYTPARWVHFFWGYDVDNAHVVTLDGYNDQQFHIADPELGVYWVNKDQFMQAYNHMKFAVAVY